MSGIATPVTPGRPRGFRWAYLLATVPLLLLPFVLWRLADQPRAVRLVGQEWVEETGRFAGVESCRECHRAIVDQQLASNHALSVRALDREQPLARFDTGQKVTDPLTGARYSMQREGKNYTISVEAAGVRASQKLDFEFGGGNHAHGYLAKLGPDTWLDTRLNYYEKIQAWDFTSGQQKPGTHLLEQPLGKPTKGVDAIRCFFCHSTVVRADGVGEEPRDGSRLRVRPDRSVLGITCEGCHGPMADHVQERRAKVPVVRKARMSADEMNQMCGRCHGLSDTDPAHPVIARFQPYGLSQSACFRASGGKMSCSTCHDPHEDSRTDQAFYVKKCLDCHSGQPQATAKTICPVNRKSGCVGCHMPEDNKSFPHTRFLDHRIRVVRKP